MRYQNHTPNDFDESPGFSPSKSFETSPARSPATLINGSNIQGTVIAHIFSKRQPQAVFPKNSNFQACITPLNYPDSCVEKNQTTKKDTLPLEHGQNIREDKNLSKNGVQMVKSRPSIPRIGPFISGWQGLRWQKQPSFIWGERFPLNQIKLVKSLALCHTASFTWPWCYKNFYFQQKNYCIE